MLISFYHLTLCPRCSSVRKHLVKLLGDDYPLTVTEINVLNAPVTTFKDGIRMVPALKCGQDILSGLTLSQDAVALFLKRNNAPPYKQNI